MTSTKAGTPDQQATRPSRARGWILTACVAAVAIIAVVIVVTTMNVGNISIVAGWFPVFLLWLTIAACVVAVVLRKDALREFAIGIPIGIVLAVALFLVLHFTGAIPAGAPRSMYVWLLVACLVIGLVLAGWRRANWPRRIAGVLAILLTVLSAGSAANATFQYYPTFSRLLGKNANHFLDNSQLKTLRDQVAKTGKLPDHGATLAITIPGQGLKVTPRPAYVWVPPAGFAPSHAKLPVIELLHGTPGQPSDWTRAIYADQTSLAYAKKHDGVAPILVMPDINGSLDGDTECANTPMYGQVETYLTQTVPAFMRNTPPTLPGMPAPLRTRCRSPGSPKVACAPLPWPSGIRRCTWRSATTPAMSRPPIKTRTRRRAFSSYSVARPACTTPPTRRTF